MKRLPLQELHHYAVPALEHAQALTLNDVRMRKAQRQARLIQEHAHRSRVLRVLLVHALDDDQAGSCVGRGRVRQVHFGHAALAQAAQKAKPSARDRLSA